MMRPPISQLMGISFSELGLRHRLKGAATGLLRMKRTTCRRSYFFLGIIGRAGGTIQALTVQEGHIERRKP